MSLECTHSPELIGALGDIVFLRKHSYISEMVLIFVLTLSMFLENSIVYYYSAINVSFLKIDPLEICALSEF